MKKLILSLAAVLTIGTTLMLLLKVFGQEAPEEAAARLKQEEQERVTLQKAESLYVAGAYDSAIVHYKGVISGFKDGAYGDKAQFRIGDCFLEKNDMRMARTAYMLFISNNPKSEYVANAFYRIGDSFLRENDDKSALSAYIYAFNNYPEFVEGEKTLYWIARWYFNQKEYKEAEYYFDKLVTWFEDREFTDAGLFYLAKIRFIRQDLKGCRKLIRRIQREYPVSSLIPDTYLLLGDTYTDYPDYTVKEQAYRDALERAPLNRNAYEKLGDIYADLALYGKAMEMYMQARNPKYRDPYEDYRKRYMPPVPSPGAPADTGWYADTLWQRRTLKIFGVLFGRQEDSTAMAQLHRFVRTVTGRPALWEAYRMMGDYHYRSGAFGEALGYYTLLPDTLRTAGRTGYRTGLAWLKTGKRAEAAAVLARLLQTYDAPGAEPPFNTDLARFGLAEARFGLGRYRDALDAYGKIGEGDADYIAYRMSSCYRALGMRDDTARLLKQMLEKYPNKYYDNKKAGALTDTLWQDSYIGYLGKIVGGDPF